MEAIPHDILVQFNAVLSQKTVPAASHDDYRKWLRYFLDYRTKYPPPEQRSEQVRLFVEKLRSKGESGRSLHDAAHALSLFFALRSPQTGAAGEGTSERTAGCAELASGTCAVPSTSEGSRGADLADVVSAAAGMTWPNRGGSKYNEWWSLEKTRSPEWDEIVIGKGSGLTDHRSTKKIKGRPLLAALRIS